MFFVFLMYSDYKQSKKEKASHNQKDKETNLERSMEPPTADDSVWLLSRQGILLGLSAMVCEFLVLGTLMFAFGIVYTGWQNAKAIKFTPGHNFELHVTEQGWLNGIGKLELDRYHCHDKDINCGSLNL